MGHGVGHQQGDGGAEREGLAEVEPQDPGEVRAELRGEGAVHAQLSPEHGDRLRGGGGAQEGDRGVSGKDPHHEEHQHQRPEHRRDDLGQPPGEMPHAEGQASRGWTA